MRNSGFALILAALLLFITGCGDTPELVVEKYMGKIMRGDLTAAESHCIGSALVITKEAAHGSRAIAEFYHKVLTEWPNIKPNVEYVLLSMGTESAEVQVTAYGQDVATFHLARADGSWKISEAAYPGAAWNQIYMVINK